MNNDPHEYKAAFDDIPGTRIFNSERARKGYSLNQFCMTLMNPINRVNWLADEEAYLKDWKITPDQKKALLNRDYNQLLELGGNIYYLAKVFSTDGLSFVQAVSTMTGMEVEDYQAMMAAGGRSPDGLRSIKDNN